MPKDKPAVEQNENSLARPPWLPPEEERRWPLIPRGKQKKNHQDAPEPGRREREAPSATADEPLASTELEDFSETSESTPRQVDGRSDLEVVTEVEYPALITPAPADEAEHRPRHARADDPTSPAVATPAQQTPTPPQSEIPIAEDRPTPRERQPSPPPELANWLEPDSAESKRLDVDPMALEEPENERVQEQPSHTGWPAADASPERLAPPDLSEQAAELETHDLPMPFNETPDAETSTTPESRNPEHPEPLDEVEQRAAALLAAMEAKRSQRAVEEPASDGPTDHSQPPDEESLLEVPSDPIEPDFAAPPAVATAPLDAPESRAETAPESTGVEADEPGPPHPPNRKIALPPWQLPGSAASAQFERFGPEKSDPEEQSEPTAPPQEAPSPGVPAAQRYPGPPPLPPAWPPPPPPPGWLPPPSPPQRGFEGDRSRPPVNSRTPPAPHPAIPPSNYLAPQQFRVPPPLEEAELANRDWNAPQTGWRRTVHKATGGHVNLGPSRRERLREEIKAQIRQPIVGDFRIAILSIKGGVGKTTTTLGLGSALAMVRHDRVIAVDANPDRGTLAERVRDVSTRSTVRDLLSDPNIRGYADIRNHTLMAPSRLEVLASEPEPAVSEVFGDADYRRTVEILRHYYNIILTDCGTGIMHSAMSGVLDLAHTIVLVSAPAMDAARSASATLDWLMQHGHSRLVRGAHVVFSASRPGSANLKLDKLFEHFETRCQSVQMIPFDPHLSEGADVDFALLRQETMDAYLDLAASVSVDFGRLRGPTQRP